MAFTNTKESGLESLIVKWLVEQNGYEEGTNADYNKEYAVDETRLFRFLQDTQPKEMDKLGVFTSDTKKRQFLNRLSGEIVKRGIIDVLRNGVKVYPADLIMFYLTPTENNEQARIMYEKNIFSATRQLRYSQDAGKLALDVCLFINGLPVITMELKNQLTKQNTENAVRQYKEDRDFHDLLFSFKRCMVHFAVDDATIQFCTKLAGKDSWFLPFNKGYNDGAGNPPNPDGLMTDYLWKDILTKRKLSRIIENYAQVIEEVDEDTKKKSIKQIWPRYHQLDCVEKLLADVQENGVGKRYLIQHSAGSGKSNSIAWLAHQLIGLEKDGHPMIDSVLVVTDRRILDKQIRNNLMDKGVIVPETANLKQRIFEEYLVDKWKPKDTRIKLKPVKNDQTAFGKLFSDPTEHIRESNLTVNYDYFYDRIQKQEITIDQLYDAICCLEIINIRLDMDDNPQLIFESLNSTGLDLSEGDKIRNFILMGLPSKEQEDYYEKYWNKIEVCTKYDVSAFIRDYLSVKQQAIPQQKKIYVNFKDFVELGKIETEPLLAEMLAYAKRYQILLDGNSGSAALDACIDRLNRLETTVTRPYFLEVLRLYNENKLTLAQVTEIFLTTENYLFRRTMCDLPTNALNKIFLMLHREIIRYDGTEDNYVEKLKYALLSKKERARFPDDVEFKAAFEERPVYLMNSKNKIYILERFENFGTSEDKDVYRHCDDGTYSIEHIMPQHLTPVWQKELGDDYEQIHELWLHRMANLTLTAYNSKYSNSSFTEKKTMQNGFDDSGIRMNTWIAKKDKWTLAELEERSDYLMGRALSIWAAPVTEYKPEEKQLDTYTLEDEGELTGRLIAKFTFKNTEQPVTSWVEMFQKVIQILYAEDKAIITKLAMSEEENIALHFNTNQDAFTKSLEIGDGIYVWTNTSTQSKLSVLSRLFKLYDEDPADLVFYLRDENEANEDEPGSRYELRRKYWTYALPIIQKAHGEDGSFSNVNPARDNWINGFFGIGGFYLCCVANFDAARAEVVFGRGNKQENKAAFDSLYTHKAEIESALGTTLQWNRGDDIKSSKVFIQLNNVSIENETDWLQMANFHADWTKKFYDVIVPFIKG